MAGKLLNVAVLSADIYTRTDNTVGYKVTALTDEESPHVCVFYKDSKDGEPKKGDRYQMVLGYDSRLKAIIRFDRV